MNEILSGGFGGLEGRATQVDLEDGAGPRNLEDVLRNAAPLKIDLNDGAGPVALDTRLSGLPLNVKAFGATGNGVADDTDALIAAENAATSVYVPPGVYLTTLAATQLARRYHGEGQIQTGSNRRGRSYSNITSAPTSFGNHNSVDTAFNGDLSKVHTVIEHRVTGATTLGQPTSGYSFRQEASATYTVHYSTSGHNHSTSINDGRTGGVTHHLKLAQYGQGDLIGYFIDGLVATTKSGSTNFLANPAVAGYTAQFQAAIDGAYLNPGEFNLTDGGYDAAAVGWVINMTRSDGTGAKGAFWAGIRSQSKGAADIDAHFSGSGPAKIGLDLVGSTFTAAAPAAIAIKAGDRIYGNATNADSQKFPNTVSLGTSYLEYSSSLTAWNFVQGGSSRLQIGSSVIATVGITSTSGLFTAQGNAGTARQLRLRTGTSDRWIVSANGTAESGTNAGSDFAVASYDDSGALLATPLFIIRSTGGVRVADTGGRVGFYGTVPIARQTITGSRGSNAALADLLTKLAALGLITDSTS